MKTTECVIALKGDRPYLQGPDMVNAIVDAIGGAAGLTALTFSIHSEIGHGHVRIFVSPDKAALPKATDSSAWLACRCGGEQVFAALVPVDDDPVIERVDYDESHILRLCRIEENRISLLEPSPVSFAETIVSMHKRLLQILFPRAPGRWAFTKLELDGLPVRVEELALEFTHNFGYRLVKSRVLSESRAIGSIFFTAWNP